MSAVKITKENGIDLFKLLMSICVIAIHTHPLKNCTNQIINLLFSKTVNLAVPFFFLASGFFLAFKMDEPFSSTKNINIVKTYLKKNDEIVHSVDADLSSSGYHGNVRRWIYEIFCN